MRLKLDENRGRQGAELLRQIGHEVVTVPEQRLCGATDAKLIAVCSALKGRVVTRLTREPDVGLLHAGSCAEAVG